MSLKAVEAVPEAIILAVATLLVAICSGSMASGGERSRNTLCSRRVPPSSAIWSSAEQAGQVVSPPKAAAEMAGMPGSRRVVGLRPELSAGFANSHQRQRSHPRGGRSWRAWKWGGTGRE